MMSNRKIEVTNTEAHDESGEAGEVGVIKSRYPNNVGSGRPNFVQRKSSEMYSLLFFGKTSLRDNCLFTFNYYTYRNK